MAYRIEPPVGPFGATTACSSPMPRSRTGSRPGGKKAAQGAWTEHLGWALCDFSGYIAADELYDGPFCILSIVDNRTFKRLAYHVLSRVPTAKDVEAFFRRFHAALEARGLSVKGITTDGSALYPEPIAAAFGDVPHQVCTFHVLREVTKAVLSAVAQERKRLAAGAPSLPRGRPGTKAARRAARRKKRIEGKVGDLFEHRYPRVSMDGNPLTIKKRLPLVSRRISGDPAVPCEGIPQREGPSKHIPVVEHAFACLSGKSTARPVFPLPRPIARGLPWSDQPPSIRLAIDS